MTRHGTGNAQRHRTIAESPPSRWRLVAFGTTVVVLVAVGLVVGFGDFLGRPDAGTAAGTPVRMSMAGFEPAIITANAGQELALELWTTDAAPHLHRGVHTMISDELGIYEELPAESRRTVTLQMPTEPGDYDIYCDTCCGGKASPTMHGILRVEAQA
jgi:plastocyanin